MPVTTYVHNEKQQTLNCEEIADLLKEVNDKDWLVREYKFEKGLIKKKIYYRYELLYKIHGCEYQIINFHISEPNIHGLLYVSADLVIAFFYGLLANKKD